MEIDVIKQEVERLDTEGLGWYQNIQLGNGIETKTRRVWGEDLDHPRKRWAEVAGAVPADLTGKSVLDVGCNAGFICLEAAARNAEYVCGVDLKPGYIEQANFCANVLGEDIDYRVASVYDVAEIGRTFDLVFFVGLLYHCQYLSQAVAAVSSVCTGTIIVETAIHPGQNELPLVRFVNSSGYEGPNAKGAARLPGHWHPNMTALTELFRAQGFSSVEELFVDGGRGGIVARR